MMIVSLALILLSCLATSVIVTIAKNRFLPSTLLLVQLIALTIATMSFKEAFDTYSILLLFSIVPLFLTTYDKAENEKVWAFSKAIAFLLTGICLTFCGLFLGKETPFGALLGLAIAFAILFLDMLLHKTFFSKATLFTSFTNFLTFLGAGLTLGTIAPVLLYSSSLANILFAVGALVFASHIIISTFWKNKFNHLVCLAGLLILISTLLVR